MKLPPGEFKTSRSLSSLTIWSLPSAAVRITCISKTALYRSSGLFGGSFLIFSLLTKAFYDKSEYVGALLHLFFLTFEIRITTYALRCHLRGRNHLGRQGRLAFMAWVSGLFSPLVSPPYTPFSVNPLFCRHPLKRSLNGKQDFYFSREIRRLPPPLSTVQEDNFAVPHN